ncbi:putative n-acetylglucosaminyl transferase, partial [Vibrio parahaemolyticus V-223/04]
YPPKSHFSFWFDSRSEKLSPAAVSERLYGVGVFRPS